MDIHVYEKSIKFGFKMRWMGYDHPTIMNNMFEQTIDLILQQIGDINPQ